MRKSRSCGIVLGSDLRIVIAGAGTLGCFVGGVLAAAGHDVTFLVRPRVAAELRTHGLTLTDFEGLALRVPPEDLTLRENPQCLAQADVILVTVRNDETSVMGMQIDAHASPDACVATLQNGPANVTLLRRLLPKTELQAGIVPFGVVALGQGCFHRAGRGDIQIGGGQTDLAALLHSDILGMERCDTITDVQWGQLLINLSHAVSALNGLTLDAQLRYRGWRKLLAEQWQEALFVLQSGGVTPVMQDRISAARTPRTLRLPTPVFKSLAGYMRPADRLARGPVAEDLLAGQGTDVDHLQGHIVALGKELDIETPINAYVLDLVHAAQDAAVGPPNLPLSAFRRLM